MPDVSLDDETYGRLLVTSRLMDEPVGEVIRRLVTRLTADAQTTVPTPNAHPAAPELVSKESDMPTASATRDRTSNWLAIFKVYKGHRIEGAFNPSTHEIRLTTEPWANRFFNSPTAAAQAVVEHFSGDERETNNTNGRKFWRLLSNGQNLRSVIGERLS